MNDDMTVTEFCNRYGITARSEWVDYNPNMSEWRDANHFKVTLIRRDPTNGVWRTMTIPFSQGYGISGEPKAASVLECLASDSTVEWYSFEQWASDLGYDPDSRQAERTYKACLAQTAKLERFLGSERLEQLRACNGR